MTDTENKALYIAEECRKAGMTLAGAAGVIANIEAESAFNPKNVQDAYESKVGNDNTYTAKVDSGAYGNFTSDAAGYGLAQWTAGSRKQLMLAYFRNRGKSIGDFQTQVDFLIYEMRQYTKAWNVVTASNNPYECGYAVCKYYEIPANTEQQANYRGELGKKWYNWLSTAMHFGEQSTIKDEPAKPAVKDEDGIDIPKTWPPRTIDSHCTGWPEVKLLQALLTCRGYSVVINGIYGEDLVKALKKFQKASGLKEDGVCGKDTWSALGISKSLFVG